MNEPTPQHPPQPAGMRIGAPIILLILALALLTGGLLAVAVQGQDRVAREASRNVVHTVGIVQREGLENLVRDWSWWNEAVEALIFEPDAEWVELNLVGWLSDNFDISRSFVFGPKLEPVVGAKDGIRIDTTNRAWQNPELQALVHRARALPEERTASLSAYIEFGDGIHLVAASKLLQDELADHHPPYPDKGVLVLSRAIDDERLAAFEQALGIGGFTLSDTLPADHRMASLPLTDPAGTPVAHLVWPPPQPGREMLAWISLPLILVFTVILVMIATLIARARHANAELLAAFEARIAAQEKLEHMARHDFLTNLENRALFLEMLQTEVALANRGDNPFAVHYIDLDRFKPINDHHGHATGDLILQEVATRLRRAARSADSIARFGGDEFAILQRDAVSPEAAATLAERVIAELTRPFECNGESCQVGASIGIAFHEPGLDPEVLIEHADQAMYRAKEAGGNCYRFHEPETAGDGD